MQNTKQRIGQDTKAELRTVTVAEQDLAHVVEKLDLTADKVAAVISRMPGRFDLVYTPGFTVETKAQVRRVDEQALTLVSLVKAEGYIFFETTADKGVDRFAQVLRKLGRIEDKRGNKVNDLYFVGFGHRRHIQNVLTPDGQVITLTKANDSGLSSIRYDETNRRLIAILRNQLGTEMLVALDVDEFKRDPARLTQVERWQTIVMLDKGMPVFSLSRPKADGPNVKFVVNFDRQARLLTLVGKNDVHWGEIYRTTEIQIGYLSGSRDFLVGYDPTGDETWINVTRIMPEHPIAGYLA